MIEQASITIDKEQTPNRHWFKGNFYRKEGAKEVLDLRKLSYISAGTFGLLVVLSFFRDLPESIPDTRSDISEPAQTSSNYSFPDIAHTEINPTPRNHASSLSTSVSHTGPQLISRPKVAIPAGTIIRARILDAATDGPVRARVTQTMRVRGEVAVTDGSLLIGAGSSAEDRLQIRFDQLIDKDGGTQSIQAEAIDPSDKMAGIKGSDLRGTAIKLGGSLGLTFLGAMTETLQEKQTGAGVAYSKPNLKNALLNGVSTTALEQSRDLLSDLRDSRPKIVINQAAEILVVF